MAQVYKDEYFIMKHEKQLQHFHIHDGSIKSDYMTLGTGGTVFASKYVAEYYLKQRDKVYVLNCDTREQPIGAILIETDRKNLTDELKKYEFEN